MLVGLVNKKIRFSHLYQHIAINCVHQQRCKVVKTAKEISICYFETHSTIWQKPKITCFRIHSFLEYVIHLYGNLAMQPFYVYM